MIKKHNIKKGIAMRKSTTRRNDNNAEPISKVVFNILFKNEGYFCEI